MTKPCIQCGKECEVLPVQLGDLFTLTFLRICSAECMFMEAYGYLYEIGDHKSFLGKLYDKQNEEDAAERKAYVDGIIEGALRTMREDFQVNPKLLSAPVPEGLLKMFEGVTSIPQRSGQLMRVARPSREDRVKWQSAHVERLKETLQEAIQDLEKLQNEMQHLF